MRLTCPNCGAQYEVPNDVIPPEGRDVQCSNCGTTWFEPHPDAPQSTPPVAPEPAPADTQPTPDPDPDPGHVEEALEHIETELVDEVPEETPAAAPEHDAPPTPERQELDASVSDILRQEAEREAQLRADENAALETQPDLGLDNLPPDEATKRARQARERMAKMKGEPEAPENPGSRRSLLPDIEEINSSLRGSTDTPRGENTALAEPAIPQKRGGFLRGFALALIIAAVLILIYANAPRIAQTVPQANPALNAYVALVDQARNWLDDTLGSVLPQ